MKMMRHLLAVLVLLAALSSVASAEVFVHDRIALAGAETRLKAETNRGKVVRFTVNGTSAGKALSGGDGFAYLTFRPPKAGLYQVGAAQQGETGKGLLLALRRGDRVVVVDIEGSITGRPFTRGQIVASRDAIGRIIKRYPVVYLHAGTLGMKAVEKWLAQNKFPESVVVPWDMGEVFSELNGKGIRVRAVVGGQAVIESALSLNPQALSFEDIEGVEKVRDWKEIEKRIREEGSRR